MGEDTGEGAGAIEPVVAAALGYAVLQERMEPQQLLGGALVLIAVASARKIPAPVAGTL